MHGRDGRAIVSKSLIPMQKKNKKWRSVQNLSSAEMMASPHLKIIWFKKKQTNKEDDDTEKDLLFIHMWFGSGLILQHIQIWVYDAFGINLPIPTSSIICLLLQKILLPPPSHLLNICGYLDCTVDCKMCFSTAEGSCHGCADVVSAPTLLHGVPLIVPSPPSAAPYDPAAPCCNGSVPLSGRVVGMLYTSTCEMQKKKKKCLQL